MGITSHSFECIELLTFATSPRCDLKKKRRKSYVFYASSNPPFGFNSTRRKKYVFHLKAHHHHLFRSRWIKLYQCGARRQPSMEFVFVLLPSLSHNTNTTNFSWTGTDNGGKTCALRKYQFDDKIFSLLRHGILPSFLIMNL